MSQQQVGGLLRHWRDARRLSQLNLAMKADISARHLSFVETGRARPSRAMILRLADALEIPLRERNTILLSAGLAPIYRETGLDATALAEVRKALQFTLERHRPFPALVMDRHWNIVMANDPANRSFQRLPLAEEKSKPINAMELVFSPKGFRPQISNWADVAGLLLRRLAREAAAEPQNGPARQLLNRILSFPDVDPALAVPNAETPDSPLILLEIKLDGVRRRLFSTIATFGTAQDITLQELRIETYFPADEETDRIYRKEEKETAMIAGPTRHRMTTSRAD